MKELTITTASYLLIGLLGVTGLVFSLVSMRKENQSGQPLKGIFWFTLTIVCLCLVVLFADYLEKVRALEMISRRVEAIILRF
jgi:cytochrome c oxidase assembly factor CtaG